MSILLENYRCCAQQGAHYNIQIASTMRAANTQNVSGIAESLKLEKIVMIAPGAIVQRQAF